MDRLRLHPGGFGQTLCRAAGGRRQQDPRSGLPERGNDAKGGRCFSRSRPSGQDQDLALHRSQDRLHLDLVVFHTGTAADALRQPCGIHPDPSPVGKDRCQTLCRTSLGKIERREIDCPLRGIVRCHILRNGDRLSNDILRVDHLVQRHGEDTFIHGKKLRSCL